MPTPPFKIFCILRGYYQAGGNLKEGDYLEDPDVGGKIIFERIFKKWAELVRTGLLWFRIGMCLALVKALMNLRVP